MKKINVEVEGSELLIQSKEGHYAVIPAKHRQEVMDMVKNGCDDCVNAYIQTLPKDSDYAEDGSLLPDWDKIKAVLNPKNWGVRDYTDKGSKDAAYAAAKKAGEKEFMWNNKRFNTKSDMSPEQQMKVYGITDEQRHVKTSLIDDTGLRKNLSILNTSNGYNTPLGVVKDVMLGNPIKDELYKLYNKDMDETAKKEQDAFRLYMGLPQQYDTFKPSKYKKGSFELNNYLQNFPEEMPSDDLINLVGRPLTAEELMEEIESENLSTEDKLKKYDVFYKAYQIKPYSDMILGRHTVRKGKDENGEYVEYIDNWDLDTYNYTISKKQLPFGIETPEIKVPIGSVADKLNKPFNIYGRQYYKDYGDGIKRKQYFLDEELSNLNINEKNFDTLALQKELINRGYKLLNSTKQDGSLDGIWGDETKNALLDYQIKNKKNEYKPLEQKDITSEYKPYTAVQDNTYVVPKVIIPLEQKKKQQ